MSGPVGGSGGGAEVLVLRALGLGDLLTAVPAVRALRRACPDARLTLAGPAGLEPLALLTGAVDRVCPVGPLTALPQAVAGADIAVNLHGRGPQSTRLLLAARPRRLVAFAADTVPETAGMPRWRAQEHEVDRWCRLLTESGVPADPEDLHLAPPPRPAPVEGAIVLHPGAAQASRRWPPRRWAQVAAGLRGYGAPLVVTGGPQERGLAEEVAALAGLPDTAVLAGRTDPLELAALLAAARLLVAPDTGVAHLATALGTPSVLLFGPTPPALWGPPPGRSLHRVLWAGRRGDPFAAHPDPGLLALTPTDVLAAAQSLLDTSDSSGQGAVGRGGRRPVRRTVGT